MYNLFSKKFTTSVSGDHRISAAVFKSVLLVVQQNTFFNIMQWNHLKSLLIAILQNNLHAAEQKPQQSSTALVTIFLKT